MRTKTDRAALVAHLKNLADGMDPSVADGHALLDHYSLRNVLLILAQMPDATVCAGFHAWRAAGRTVRKGSKGLAILAPMTVPSGEDGEPGRTFFRVVYVFDVSQTDVLAADSPRLARELVTA
jgi:hypothetical protein